MKTSGLVRSDAAAGPVVRTALWAVACLVVAGLLLTFAAPSLPLPGALMLLSAVGIAGMAFVARASQQSYAERMDALTRDLSDARSDLDIEEVQSRALLENAVDGIVSIDAKGTILSANAATGTLFGYEPADLIGQNVRVLAGGVDHARHDGYIQNHMNTGENKIIGRPREVLGQRADGSTFPVDLSVARLGTKGSVRFIGVLRDLTARVALEDQLRQAQKLEVVGQLTGGVAHDFNNLLAIIQGNLGMLQDDLAAGSIRNSDEAAALCDDALHAAQRGADLTRSLLAFSRKQQLMPERFDVNGAIRRMENMLVRTLGEGIDLKVITKDGGWQVEADRSQLESAVLNLVVNARDALNHEGILTIETSDVVLDAQYASSHEEVTTGDYVLIAVSDDGPGMSEDVLTHALEPFFTTKEVGEGSGLGLSMIYGFSKQSNGHLSIYSEEGVGTTVKLYLPRSHSPEETAGETEDVAPPPVAGTERVLVIEDDEALQMTVTKILKRNGYNVLMASDGKTALELMANAGHIDILLSDVVLPGGMSGPQLVEKAEKIHGPIKVLFMSGYTKEAVLHRGHLPEDTHLIHKPFSPRDLGAALRAVLEED